MIQIKGLSQNITKFDKIEEFLNSKNEPQYRFIQIADFIFKKRVEDLGQISTLPNDLRKELKEKFHPLLSITLIDKKEASQVTKVIFKLKDEERIETVKMNFKGEWISLCISSQVGCGLGCLFCTTGKIGLKRNLTPDEIIDQPLYFYLKGENIHSISFMGMGEPLLNPATFIAIKSFTDKNLFGFSQRRISLSTVGIIPGLKRLIREFPQINIAFSLHTPFEQQRRKLMPISYQFPIIEVLKILDEYMKKNKRKVFLEYLMLKGVNDTPEHLKVLKKIILDRKRDEISHLYHVNLIRYNPSPETRNQFQSSKEETIEYFKKKLKKSKINVTLRQSFGSNIYAACGQLYAQYKIER